MARYKNYRTMTPWILLALGVACLVWVNDGARGAGQGNNQGGLPAVAARVSDLEEELSGVEADYSEALGQIAALADRVTALEGALSRIAALENKLQHVRVEPDELAGVAGPHLIIEGCNVHVRSGSGGTSDLGSLNGLGNLIVGYNEFPTASSFLPGDRGGSHNVVVGEGHRFSNFGGLVAGQENTISGQFASVTGGWSNTASAGWSSVSGGRLNQANGGASAVSGGSSNIASGWYASVSGGWTNTASGNCSSASGGSNNEAAGDSASVSGGARNAASGDLASISGGVTNVASGYDSSVSGGGSNEAAGRGASVSGGAWNSAEGSYSSISGGFGTAATELYEHPDTHRP